MSKVDIDGFVEKKLLGILEEMEAQKSLSTSYPEDGLSFEEEVQQIREYIEDAGEYSIAYEVIVANLEQIPFLLTGSSAVALLEVGLVMKYKTDREEDLFLDSRE
ncbi:hypothetical protein [Microbulbifer rhizosphaerae]|uniref:Uncharacterized protein n=1 Tax=Microbulbifer rhizosphaerae TaxID=1562603 RepID=A0A7W4WAG7_9GAMM|nr:hypothetical protein [Microbulbifer rhizosphaerae]MBB3059991.1 hypothetical protein [Microbulbifer rhizosphaerae]